MEKQMHKEFFFIPPLTKFQTSKINMSIVEGKGIFDSHYEKKKQQQKKKNTLHMRKQRRRSASG